MTSNIRYFPSGSRSNKPLAPQADWSVRIMAVVLYLLLGWMSRNHGGLVLNLAFMMVFSHWIFVQGRNQMVLKILLAFDLLFTASEYLQSSDAALFLALMVTLFLSLNYQRKNPQLSYFSKYHYFQGLVFIVIYNFGLMILEAVFQIFESFLSLLGLSKGIEQLFSNLLSVSPLEGGAWLALLLFVLPIGISVFLASGALLGKLPNFPYISAYIRRWI
jgi:hypothetical protein